MTIHLSLNRYVWPLGFLTIALFCQTAVLLAADKPNLIWIMADDLGWGDLGCFGQKKIKTPCLDRMAAEGILFTSAYCGTSVCAPSRASLITGLHMGHCPIRANREVQPEGQMPLPKAHVTVAELLQRAGYRTGLFGKWGLGFPGSGSEPTRRGFDTFYGYNCQRHAHGYYPQYLWRNDHREPLPCNAGGKQAQYSHDSITAEALRWVHAQRTQPFFLYFAVTIPHAQFQVPDCGPYANENWPEDEKRMASMITRLDRDIGRLFDLLKELQIDERTLVFFVSDNGAMGSYKEHDLEFFDSNGPFRGFKRSMYEGGLRVPAIARWPGRIKPGAVSDEPWAFWDFLPTAAEVAGFELPRDLQTDGVSIAPLLFGRSLPRRQYFYWELHEGPTQQALRFGDWKAVRTTINRPLELYDLRADRGETRDLAKERPELVAQAEALMKSARVDSADFPLRAPQAKSKPKAQKTAQKSPVTKPATD